MNSLTKLTVVIPCLNEEANIPRYSLELFDPIRKLAPQVEYVFVDDGSTDKTKHMLDDIAKRYLNARVISHQRNLGLGAALRSGFAAATGDMILTIDADLTFHPGECQKLFDAFTSGVDAVLGSPLLGRMEHVPMTRRFLSHGVNIAYRLLLKKPITSASSIFRLYKAEAIRSLNLSCTSFDINAEIIFQLVRMGGNILEVPVILLTRTGGVSKISPLREIRNHLRILGKIFCWRLGLTS